MNQPLLDDDDPARPKPWDCSCLNFCVLRLVVFFATCTIICGFIFLYDNNARMNYGESNCTVINITTSFDDVWTVNYEIHYRNTAYGYVNDQIIENYDLEQQVQEAIQKHPIGGSYHCYYEFTNSFCLIWELPYPNYLIIGLISFCFFIPTIILLTIYILGKLCQFY
jgi:hypothetical protein